MKNYIFLCVVFIACLISCDKEENYNKIPQLNKYIENFSVGDRSRHEYFHIRFSENIPTNVLNQETLKEAITITPKINGSFNINDDNVVFFKPDKPFERACRYTINIKMNKIVKDATKEDDFKFFFKTVDPKASLEITGIKIDDDVIGDPIYLISGMLRFSDMEDSALVHSLLGISERCNISWDKTSIGKRYSFQMHLKQKPEVGKKIKFLDRKSVV